MLEWTCAEVELQNKEEESILCSTGMVSIASIQEASPAKKHKIKEIIQQILAA
jgi:hypothetical protein